MYILVLVDIAVGGSLAFTTTDDKAPGDLRKAEEHRRRCNHRVSEYQDTNISSNSGPNRESGVMRCNVRMGYEVTEQ
ncbi:hypothetical protein D9619_010568 [Psilocybe cf. subviscida]|uniref:Secreted protein n=1 Tax=Psilocybe cf. subviscida TaxID=2480587 RepID=A0A8H5ERP7_9AGAR|nr:hypothetical protein D9619_010568 [Psilocybe cf. subviscida]